MRANRLSIIVLGFVVAGCGDDEAQSANTPGIEAGIDAVVEVGQDTGAEAGVDALPDSPPDSLSDSPPDSPWDSQPDVADEAAEDAPADAPVEPPEPTAADIEFQAVNPIPSGQHLLFNDWDASPNSVSALSLDGSTTTEIFRAYRVWSMGVSRAGDRIAFACGDPEQAQNYGINLGDAIQHTWIYDIASQTAEVVAWGNINDECHAFGPGDERLYVCRRYDFTDAPSYKGWRLGVIEMATGDFSFLTDDVTNVFALHPQPNADETELYYSLIDVPASPPSGLRSIRRMPLPSGASAAVRAEADSPLLSPDGTRYLYRNLQDARTLWSSSIDGTTTFRVVAAEATEPVFSPDGSQVAYLLRDDANNCDHIYIAASDGSQASSPVRIRDCAATGEFITELDWVDVP